MKKPFALILSLAVLFSLASAALALTLTPIPSVIDVYEADKDAIFTRDQVLTLMEEAYEIGFKEGKIPGVDEGSRPSLQIAASLAGTRGPTEHVDYVLNIKSKKFHDPACSSINDINPENRKEFTGTREQLILEGYSPCGKCKP